MLRLLWRQAQLQDFKAALEVVVHKQLTEGVEAVRTNSVLRDRVKELEEELGQEKVPRSLVPACVVGFQITSN